MAKRQRGYHWLTEREVETLPEGRYPDGKRLYLQVKGNSRSWLFRTREPRPHGNWMGLGSIPAVTLEKARAKAQNCREQMDDGIDPLVAHQKAERDKRLAAAKEVTFRECAEGWMARNAVTWTPKYAEDVKRLLETYAYPKLEGGNLPIQKLDIRTENSAAADLVFNVLKPLWRPKEEGGRFVTAQRLRLDIEGILNWAWAADYIQGDAAAMKAKLDLLLPDSSFHDIKHHAALDFKEIGQFMATLRACVDKTGTVRAGRDRCNVCSHPQRQEIENARQAGASFRTLGERFDINHQSIQRHCAAHLGSANRPHRHLPGYATELIILTAARKGEVLKSEWKDVDWDNKLLIVPWQKHKVGKKTKRDHIIPLSDAAMKVLQTVKEQQEINGFKSNFVFASRRSPHLSKASVNKFLNQTFNRRDLTVHGFRTTFRSWAKQYFPEKAVIAELCIGHAVPALEAIYGRDADVGELCRPLLDTWGAYCDRPEPPATGAVIDFLQAKRGIK